MTQGMLACVCRFAMAFLCVIQSRSGEESRECFSTAKHSRPKVRCAVSNLAAPLTNLCAAHPLKFRQQLLVRASESTGYQNVQVRRMIRHRDRAPVFVNRGEVGTNDGLHRRYPFWLAARAA
jgi:hypothetical protein